MKRIALFLWLVVFCFSAMSRPNWRMPLQPGLTFKINTTFNDPGDIWHTDAHNGYWALDFSRPIDGDGNYTITDHPVIVASAAGVVIQAGLDGATVNDGIGYCVRIDHGDGDITEYGHFDQMPIVSVGDIVMPGQKLGVMGTTGNSTGIHLHWRIKHNNQCYSWVPEANPLPLTAGKYKIASDVAVGKKIVSDNYRLSIADEFNFSNRAAEGWTLGWDVVAPQTSGQSGYGADNGSWFIKVGGPNPGIVSPKFVKTLMARSTVMEFSAKVNVNVDPSQVGRIWVKDEHGSWNNSVQPKLFNYAYNYNNGNFKNGDYNVYYVDFYDIRSPENEIQYGKLQIEQFSIELTKALNNPDEYWAIDWVKIYSKNGSGYVYIASSGSVSSSSSEGGYLSGSGSSGSSTPTPPTPPPTPRYQYSGAWTCQGFADGTIQWSKVPVNPKTQFNQGEDVNCLVEIKDISVNHCLKVDIYKDSSLYWTWGGTYWCDVGENTWGYSYGQVTNANASPGNYEFRVSIDTGAGFQQIDSKSCTVLSTQPRFVYSGAWVCDSIADGPVEWTKMAVNARTTYKREDKACLLVEYANVYVNHRHKVDIYYNGIYSWTWGDDQWLDVGQWGWGHSYVMPYIGSCQAGEYEFKVFLDTGVGYWQTDSKTFTVINSGPGYNYSGAWTCDSAIDGAIEWSKVPANIKTRFVQGGNVCCLAVFNDVSVTHRIKADIYKDGAYSWTWGDGSWNTVNEMWSYSNAIIMNNNVGTGEYEFQIFIDVGNGYQQVDSKTCQVDTSGPPFIYSGSWTCDSVADGAEQWSKVAVNAKTNFVAGQTMYCLSVFKDVYVTHRIKVDVYKDSTYSWTWGNGDWNVVSGTWAYSNAIVANSSVSAGQYEFRIYFDSGSGYQLVDIRAMNVSSN